MQSAALLFEKSLCSDRLDATRTRLLAFRQRRTGLYIARTGSPFFLIRLAKLLRQIAAQKLEELRLMIALDFLLKRLAANKPSRPRKIHSDLQREPKRRRKPAGLAALTLLLLTRAWRVDPS
jgi:hypothetical protein